MYLLGTFKVQLVLKHVILGQQAFHLTVDEHGRVVLAVDAHDAFAEVFRSSVCRKSSLWKDGALRAHDGRRALQAVVFKPARVQRRAVRSVLLDQQGFLLTRGAEVSVALVCLCPFSGPLRSRSGARLRRRARGRSRTAKND